MNWPALIVFCLLFAFVTVLGFVAANWRRGDLSQLHEWGLGGRRFGTFVTWFLLGGDLYTAYTFIAVPALMFGQGAIGYFAVPYTVMIYPLLYLVFPRLWAVARRHGYVTSCDFVRGRFGNKWLELALAVTGLFAVMPYIALQLVGMEVVLGALGFRSSGWMGELPLIVAFLILAIFTYSSGLRAPAMIAVVKDLLIYITVIATVIVVPLQLGGYDHVFAAIQPAKLLLATPPPGSTGVLSGYATLALGSAFTLFLYPHSTTAILSSSDGSVIRRNAAILPAYSILLALLALMGFMAVAAGVKGMPQFAQGFRDYGNNFSVPALMIAAFPPWFVGVAFAAIAIGALVPAAIMSIAAANTFTRNIWRSVLRPSCTDAEEAGIAKIVSLVVKVGALVFILTAPQEYAINMQLLGGIWIIQTAPAVMGGVFTRFFNGWALLAGWAVGISLGTWMELSLGFKASVFTIHLFGTAIPGYAALWSGILNLLVSTALSLVLNAVASDRHRDMTVAEDYA